MPPHRDSINSILTKIVALQKAFAGWDTCCDNKMINTRFGQLIYEEQLMLQHELTSIYCSLLLFVSD